MRENYGKPKVFFSLRFIFVSKALDKLPSLPMAMRLLIVASLSILNTEPFFRPVRIKSLSSSPNTKSVSSRTTGITEEINATQMSSLFLAEIISAGRSLAEE